MRGNVTYSRASDGDVVDVQQPLAPCTTIFSVSLKLQELCPCHLGRDDMGGGGCKHIGEALNSELEMAVALVAPCG